MSLALASFRVVLSAPCHTGDWGLCRQAHPDCLSRLASHYVPGPLAWGWAPVTPSAVGGRLPPGLPRSRHSFYTVFLHRSVRLLFSRKLPRKSFCAAQAAASRPFYHLSRAALLPCQKSWIPSLPSLRPCPSTSSLSLPHAIKQHRPLSPPLPPHTAAPRIRGGFLRRNAAARLSFLHHQG
ncbi:MAG: hypothetical protein J3K34DRAFT_424632 [Monoraphidium minutum]|nr:MAG: hypothetical protein J3K34DRAFT_424632 [Monoraphidium minutum]